MTDDRRRQRPAKGAGANLLSSTLCSLASATHAPMLHDSFRERVRSARRGPRRRLLPSVLCHLPSAALRAAGRLPRPGDHSVRAPPDPIPNSAVKPHRAQGTALLRVGERVVARSSQPFQGSAQRSEIGDQRSALRVRSPGLICRRRARRRARPDRRAQAGARPAAALPARRAPSCASRLASPQAQEAQTAPCALPF